MEPELICNATQLIAEAATLFYKKGVLTNFAKFTGRYLCQTLGHATLFKKRLRHMPIPVNFANFFKNAYFVEHLRTAASMTGLSV